mgnify:CR=1 FL=1
MVNSTEQFQLSDEQKAILASKGNTMVVSNPGTGKTTTLGLKVMDLLESGVDPEEILCITFTAKAKKEMFDKIFSMSQGKFPDSDIMKLNIHTFHGFANDYLTEAGLLPSNIVGNNALRYSILESFIDNDALNYSKSYIIDTIVPKVENAIRYIKSFGITPEKIDVKQAAQWIQNNYQKQTRTYTKEDLKTFLGFFVAAYQSYEDSKVDTIDYSDMLLTFLEKHRGDKFKHVLVDEMQDMNEIEAKIVEMVSETIFLVGDVKQAIFGFQGGSTKNFEKFQKNCNSLMLSTNRRSTQEILDYSKQVFLNGTGYREKFEQELEKFEGVSNGSLPKIFGTGAPLGKTVSLIKEIQKDNPEKSIGVITRKNYQIVQVSKFLDHNNISYTTTSSQATTKEARSEIVIYLKGLLSNDSKQKITASFSTFSPFSLQEAFEFSNKKKNMPDFKVNLARESLNQLFSEEIYPLCVSKGSEWFATAVSVKEQIDEYFTMEKPTVEGLFDFIKIVEESYVDSNEESNVTLTSVHKSKGRTFDIVVYYPSKKRASSFIDPITESILLSNDIDVEDEIEEESLRIDFVAFTRAAKKLIVLVDDKTKDEFVIDDASTLTVDPTDKKQQDVTSFSDFKLAEAYSLFVAGKFDDAKKLLNQTDDWLIKYIHNYFNKLDNLSYSAIKLTNSYDFLKSRIMKVPTYSQTSSGGFGAEFGDALHKDIEKLLKEIDLVLIMSVYPGFGGQKFIPEVIEKIKKLYQIKKDNNLKFDIEVDGGINFSNSKEVISAGANILVSGTTIFKENNGDIKKNIETLKSM